MARPKRLDRKMAYDEFNAAARFAILRITNAIADAKVAEQLHSSRQPMHLDSAATELSEALVLLREAATVLKPMREFIPAEKRRKKATTKLEHHAPQTTGSSRQEEGTEEVLYGVHRL